MCNIDIYALPKRTNQTTYVQVVCCDKEQGFFVGGWFMNDLQFTIESTKQDFGDYKSIKVWMKGKLMGGSVKI